MTFIICYFPHFVPFWKMKAEMQEKFLWTSETIHLTDMEAWKAFQYVP